MVASARVLFATDGLMPNGHCYLWGPELLCLHATSDALIIRAYFWALFKPAYPARRRWRLEFNWMCVK